jgi:hypothetical protein
VEGRKFFYIPVNHFVDGQARFHYPTLPQLERVIETIRWPPWGGILDAQILTGDFNYTKKIRLKDGLWSVTSNLEVKDLLGGRKPGPAILAEITPKRNIVGLGSIFFVDMLSKLAGKGAVDDSILHAIAAATREGVVYGVSFAGVPGNPELTDTKTHKKIALSVQDEFPGFNQDDSDLRAGPDALGAFVGAGMDGAMG